VKRSNRKGYEAFTFCYIVDFICAYLLNCLSETKNTPIRISEVLPGLNIDIIEEALMQGQTEDDVTVSRWLMSQFNQIL
jgi:hypothetical protein